MCGKVPFLTTRCVVKYINFNESSVAKVCYYITGAAHFSRSKNVTNPALWDSVTLDYADQFSDGNGPTVSYNTFAYPTTVTDPDGFQAKSEYNFYFGAPVKATGPPPAGQSQGTIVRRVYDSIGRVERVKTEFNGNADYSHTRWEYPATGNKVNQFTTITDSAGEAYAYTQTDGLGRAIFAVTGHPGRIGGYSAVLTTYDTYGRPGEVSVPTAATRLLIAGCLLPRCGLRFSTTAIRSISHTACNEVSKTRSIAFSFRLFKHKISFGSRALCFKSRALCFKSYALCF